MGRDGRSKSKKGGRGGGGRGGGGKLFVANIEELQMREEQIHEHQRKRAERRGESDDEEENDQEQETQELETNEKTLADREREARAEALKAQAIADELNDDVGKTSGLLGGLEIANPNKNMNKMMKVKNMGDGESEEPQLSRREREAIDAARRKAEYDRLHAAGKTDAAKADMKRLAEVRRRREEAEKKCVAEGRKPGWTENGVEESDGSDSDEEEEKTAKPKAATAVPSAAEAKKKAAAMETVDTSGEIPKLSSIEIKKMNADAVKEHLKTRGLSTQGQKKDLMKRLVDYEAARE